MKIVLLDYGDITNLVKKDDLIFLIAILSENQEVSEELSLRIEDLNGSIESFLLSSGAWATLSIYDDSNSLIANYKFTGKYERTEDFYFIDAQFKREIVPSDVIVNRTGFFDINTLLSKTFNVARQDLFLPSNPNYVYLNVYDTLSEIPISDFSGISVLTYDNYVFIAHQNILIRYDKTTKTYQSFTVPQYAPESTSTTRRAYFGQSNAPIQVKLLGFRVENGTPFIYFVSDEVYHDGSNIIGYYTIRKFPANFTTAPSYQVVKIKLVDMSIANYVRFQMLCDLSTIIPLGIQSANGNFDELVWIKVRVTSFVEVYHADLNFNLSLVHSFNPNLSGINTRTRKQSDSYFYDSTRWAVVWNNLIIVKWAPSYYHYQITAGQDTPPQNCYGAAVFYDANYNKFKCYIGVSKSGAGKYVEVHYPFNNAFREYVNVGYMFGGRNAGITWLYSDSPHFGTYETQYTTKSIPNVELNVFTDGYLYSDAFVGFVDNKAVIGFVQAQPNVSVYIKEANTQILSIVSEIKKILSDAVIFDPTTKQFYSPSSQPPSGTINKDDYTQEREEAFTRKNFVSYVTFADGFQLPTYFEEKEVNLSYFYTFQGYHLFFTFSRWKKYEILSPRSDLTIGQVYTFIDQEGRSQTALVKKKYLEFSGLWKYELTTIEYPSTIEYTFPPDRPSLLVLDVDFSHGLTEYGTHFEHLAKISWRSLGVEPPLRVYITVIDRYTGDVVVDEWSFISRSGTYYVRWTASKLTNYTVTARFVSAHDVDEYSWNIRYLTEAEPKKSAVLLDIVNFARNPIFYNPNAHFPDGLAHWETNSLNRTLSPGEYLMTADYYPAIYLEKIFTNIYVNLWAEPNGRVELFVKLYDENYNELYEETIPITEDITGWPVDIWKSYSRDIYTTEPIKYYRVGIRNISTETEYAGVYVGTFGLFYYTWANGSQNSDTVDGYHASSFALSTHTHDARYLRKDTSDTLNGTLTATSDMKAQKFVGQILASEPTPNVGEVIWYTYDDGSYVYVKVAVNYGEGVKRYVITSWRKQRDI